MRHILRLDDSQWESLQRLVKQADEWDLWPVLESEISADPLKFPLDDGEWGFQPEGSQVVESVVFVEGTHPGTDDGHVRSDLNDGRLEGRPLRELKGLWHRIIIA